MKKLVLAFLALAAAALPARPASPEFRVELFSNRVVKALTLEATEQSVSICGAKTDGPCLVLPPTKKISCFADRLVHCRLEATDRSFTLLTVNSTAPFRIAPTFAKVNEPPQTFLMRNARVTLTSGGLQVITRVDLESYVSGVLRGEASVLRSSRGAPGHGDSGPHLGAPMAGAPPRARIRFLLAHPLPGFPASAGPGSECRGRPRSSRSRHTRPGAAISWGAGGPLLHGVLRGNDGSRGECLARPRPTVFDFGSRPLLPREQPRLVEASANRRKRCSRFCVRILHLPMALPLAELSVEKRDSSGRALVLRAVAGRHLEH